MEIAEFKIIPETSPKAIREFINGINFPLFIERREIMDEVCSRYIRIFNPATFEVAEVQWPEYSSEYNAPARKRIFNQILKWRKEGAGEIIVTAGADSYRERRN